MAISKAVNLASVRDEILTCLRLEEHLITESLRASASDADGVQRTTHAENDSVRRILDASGCFAPDNAVTLLNNMLKLKRMTELSYFAKHLPFAQWIRRKLFLLHSARAWRFAKQGTHMLMIEERVIAAIARQLLALETPAHPLLRLSDRQLTRTVAATGIHNREPLT